MPWSPLELDPLRPTPNEKRYIGLLSTHAQERLQQYSRRIAGAVRAHEAETQNRSMAVDIGAANRFIEHAIPELSDDQKKKLREVRAVPPNLTCLGNCVGLAFLFIYEPSFSPLPP